MFQTGLYYITNILGKEGRKWNAWKGKKIPSVFNDIDYDSVIGM